MIPATMRCPRCERDRGREFFKVAEHDDGTSTRSVWCVSCTLDYKVAKRAQEDRAEA